MKTVMQKYYENEIPEYNLISEIDIATLSYHEKDRKYPLYEFLGLCWIEYCLFVSDAGVFLKQMHLQKFSSAYNNSDD